MVDAYLGGANVDHSVTFRGSANAVEEVTMHNYYLRRFDEWHMRWHAGA